MGQRNEQWKQTHQAMQSALEMLVVGSVAAMVAFGVGALIKSIVGPNSG